MPHENTLLKLAIRDDMYVDSLLAFDTANVAASALDRKTHALVRLAALIAIDAAPASYMWTIETLRRCAVTDDEIVGCLIAVMPAIGIAGVVSAAPKLGLAIGFDVEHALEARLP